MAFGLSLGGSERGEPCPYGEGGLGFSSAEMGGVY
jgi:hypothetical protein